MAYGFVYYTCWFMILTIFVDRGDGRGKKKDRENLRHDIELLRKMADKIEHEINGFYKEYSNKKLKEQMFYSLRQKYKENTRNDVKNITWVEVQPTVQIGHTYQVKHKNAMEIPRDGVQYDNDYQSLIQKKHKNPMWPKFDDILLEMGKRYDWKNDRWLKVKVKLKETGTNDASFNNLDLHEKHKFHYRIVKLNKSKNRRNIVVAVSAVR